MFPTLKNLFEAIANLTAKIDNLSEVIEKTTAQFSHNMEEIQVSDWSGKDVPVKKPKK